MVDALVSFVAENLLKMARDETILLTGVGKELEDLSGELRTIRVVLQDAEMKQIQDEAVRIWLQKLKYVAYEIEDMVEAWDQAVVMGSWEDTTNWLGSYGFRLPGNPDVRRGVRQGCAGLIVVGCVASTGLAHGLRPFFSMFGMQMNTVDALTSQPAQPMGLLCRLSHRHLP